MGCISSSYIYICEWEVYVLGMDVWYDRWYDRIDVMRDVMVCGARSRCYSKSDGWTDRMDDWRVK